MREEKSTVSMSFIGERIFDNYHLAIETIVGRNVVLILRGNDGLFVDNNGRMPHDNLALAERFGYNWTNFYVDLLDGIFCWSRWIL